MPRTQVGAPDGALGLQRSIGNRAVAALLANGRAMVQRDAVKQAEYAFRGDEFLIGKADEGDVDAIKAISDYAALSREKRMKYLGLILSQADLGWRDRSAVLHLWQPEGDAIIAAARADTDLWARSVKANGDVAAIGPLVSAPTQFTVEVRQLARGILGSNDAEVIRQLDRLGAEADGTMRSSLNDSKDAARLQAMQKGAAQIAAAQDYQRSLLTVSVGYTDAGYEAGGRRAVPLSELVGTDAQKAEVEAPPYPTDQGAPSLQETLRAYNLAGSIVRGTLARWPALYAAAAGEARPMFGSEAMEKAAGDPEAARKQFVTALSETRSHISSAQGKIEDPLLPLELTTLHKRLMSADARTSLPWGDPVYRPVVDAAVKQHNEQEAAMALGLGAVAALGFIVAEFATGGLATFLLATGTTASVLAAGTAIDKAVTATALEGSSVSEETRLIEEGKASEAVVDAALATVFAVFDVALTAKALAGSGKAAATAISELEKVPEAQRAAKIEAAVDQLGVSGTIKASGKSAEELIAMLPAASRVAEKLRYARGRIAVATGLGASRGIHLGAEAAEGLAKEWAALTTVENRIAWLEQRLNAALAESGVPHIRIRPDPNTSETSFFFLHRDYEITIPSTQFINSRSVADINSLVARAFHEGRHAEQSWLAARRLAFRGLDPVEIRARIGMPEALGRRALAEPLADTAAEAAAVDRWLESIGTAEGKRIHSAVMRDVDAASEEYKNARTAEKAAEKSGDRTQINAARNRREDAEVLWDAAYDQYRKLPEELDSHGVEEAIRERIAEAQRLREAGAPPLPAPPPRRASTP